MNPISILELNFPSIPDEKISIGTWIILWDEIYCKKIGEHLYEVYDSAIFSIKSFDEQMAERAKELKLMFSDIPEKDVLHNFFKEELEPTSKYIKTSKGTKRARPWESPKYY